MLPDVPWLYDEVPVLVALVEAVGVEEGAREEVLMMLVVPEFDGGSAVPAAVVGVVRGEGVPVGGVNERGDDVVAVAFCAGSDRGAPLDSLFRSSKLRDRRCLFLKLNNLSFIVALSLKTTSCAAQQVFGTRHVWQFSSTKADPKAEEAQHRRQIDYCKPPHHLSLCHTSLHIANRASFKEEVSTFLDFLFVLSQINKDGCREGGIQYHVLLETPESTMV